MKIFRDLIHNHSYLPWDLGRLTIPQILWLYMELPKDPPGPVLDTPQKVLAEIARQKAMLEAEQAKKAAQTTGENFVSVVSLPPLPELPLAPELDFES